MENDCFQNRMIKHIKNIIASIQERMWLDLGMNRLK